MARALRKKTNVRLPNHLIPQRYKLMLKPDLSSFTFTGEESIELNLTKPVRQIILHSQDLEVFDVKFIKGKTEVEAKKISYDKDAQTVTFNFPKSLPKGNARLDLKFKGILLDKLVGFYRSKYLVDGNERYMATTQFESTDARRAFPCIDEPSRKAIFDVTLMIPAKTVAISNTLPTNIAEHERGYQVVEFAPTPKMSTYLLAFIIGEFEYVETKTKNGVLVRVFVTPGKKSQAKFALETAKKVLEFFEDYFNVPYPLPVLDLIAIPDFQAAAMENWGAVTYREAAILVDESKSSMQSKQSIALVIAHELAHQWFGNLVTMEWWTHLWLNEGFANYMEYLAVDELFPEWDIWTQFVFREFGTALKLDGLNNTHPIEIEVHHPKEIEEIFDTISYAKGSCVIRMLADFLGYKDFRDGLRSYLKKYAYANAETKDLWDAFEKVSKKPVNKIMHNWITKPGYPVITVEEWKRSIKLYQSRYFTSIKARRKIKDKTLWQVPIITQSEKSSKLEKRLMSKKMLSLPKPKDQGWLKINAGETSFIRVDYPGELLERFRPAILAKKLSAQDRLGIIRDSFELSESGLLPAHMALNLAKDYKDEDDYSVLVELSFYIDHLATLLNEESYFKTYQNFARSIFSPIAKKIGWEEKKKEKHTQILMRPTVLLHAGMYGDEEVLKTANKLFWGMVKKGEALNANLRGVVYNLTAQKGGVKEFEALLKLYKASELQEEKTRILRALGNFRDPELITRALEFALSSEVRAQDAFFTFYVSWDNPKGRDITWKFVKENWDELFKRYSDGFLLDRFFEGADNFTKKIDEDDFKKFFARHEAPGAERTIKQVLEKIESNRLWLKRDGKGIAKFLENYS